MIRFVLASASPARRATLLRAGVVPEVIVSSVDEDALTAAEGAATTAELAQLLADAKARDIAGGLRGQALVLGCDSLLDFRGEALGKPGTVEAAMQRWQQLRGASATLHTGHCLLDVATGRSAVATVASTVEFAEVTDEEIESYCRTGEAARVAGAFTIDGLGGWFVESVHGDPHNVVGVSLPALRHLLHELGFTLPELGYPRC
ncbi:MAG: Maf family protein [Jatrophihabitantaceae bacterium]